MYKKFSDLLQQRGLRAADVSRGTGISQTVFSEWKKGKSQPKTDKLQLIADYFDVPLEYFTGKNEDEKSISPKNERDAMRETVNNLINTISDEDFDRFVPVVQAFFSDKFKK